MNELTECEDEEANDADNGCQRRRIPVAEHRHMDVALSRNKVTGESAASSKEAGTGGRPKEIKLDN